MGLFDMVRGQLIDVIEWTDDSGDTLVHKYDMNGKEIMMGAQLTVRESQAAVFVDEGRLADVFGPGRYELTTRNLPVMTALRAWKFGFNSPFKSDVYFVSTRQFMDRKWGTANPVMMRDSEFGMIRVRAFGSFSFRVKDPAAFMREVFGHQFPLYRRGRRGADPQPRRERAERRHRRERHPRAGPGEQVRRAFPPRAGNPRPPCGGAGP